jgi:hypothetical protein
MAMDMATGTGFHGHRRHYCRSVQSHNRHHVSVYAVCAVAVVWGVLTIVLAPNDTNFDAGGSSVSGMHGGGIVRVSSRSHGLAWCACASVVAVLYTLEARYHTKRTLGRAISTLQLLLHDHRYQYQYFHAHASNAKRGGEEEGEELLHHQALADHRHRQQDQDQEKHQVHLAPRLQPVPPPTPRPPPSTSSLLAACWDEACASQQQQAGGSTTTTTSGGGGSGDGGDCHQHQLDGILIHRAIQATRRKLRGIVRRMVITVPPTTTTTRLSDTDPRAGTDADADADADTDQQQQQQQRQRRHSHRHPSNNTNDNKAGGGKYSAGRARGNTCSRKLMLMCLQWFDYMSGLNHKYHQYQHPNNATAAATSASSSSSLQRQDTTTRSDDDDDDDDDGDEEEEEENGFPGTRADTTSPSHLHERVAVLLERLERLQDQADIARDQVCKSFA